MKFVDDDDDDDDDELLVIAIDFSSQGQSLRSNMSTFI